MDKEIVFWSSPEYEIKISPHQIGEFTDGQQEFNSNYNQQRNNLKS